MQPMQARQLGTICTAENTAHISSLGCGAALAEEADWELLPAGCQNVRNRNIIILARMDVKIKSLTLGHAGSAVHGKPRITNQVRLGVVGSSSAVQRPQPYWSLLEYSCHERCTLAWFDTRHMIMAACIHTCWPHRQKLVLVALLRSLAAQGHKFSSLALPTWWRRSSQSCCCPSL